MTKQPPENTQWVVETKLVAPALHALLVPRPELLEQIESAILNHPLADKVEGFGAHVAGFQVGWFQGGIWPSFGPRKQSSASSPG